MKTSLIYFTGSPDPLFAGRLLAYTKNTRLTQGEDTRARFFAMEGEELAKELSYIATTIRSSWEFVDYVFQIECVGRGFTHQFVRTRTISFAQQSQRSVDVSGFGYVTPPGISENQEYIEAWQDTMQTISDAYEWLIENGAEIQDARGLLPTNIHTNIIAKINLRTLADLVGKRDNPRAQGEYTDVVKSMVQQVLDIHPWAHDFLYPKRLETPALDKLISEALGGRTPMQCPEINLALKELDRLKGIWG